MLRISFSKCSKFTEIVIEIANVFHIFMSYHPARSSTIERIGRRESKKIIRNKFAKIILVRRNCEFDFACPIASSE